MYFIFLQTSFPVIEKMMWESIICTLLTLKIIRRIQYFILARKNKLIKNPIKC